MTRNSGTAPNGNLAYWLARHAALRPERVSIVYWHSDRECERWTFGQLQTAVRRLAEWMHAQGIRAGDRVAFHDLNDVRFIITMFAAAHLGAIYVPLNFRLSAPELGHMIADCGARLVVHGARFTDHLPTILVQAGELALLSSNREGDDAFAAVIGAERDDTPPLAELDWGETAWLLYTSGSTGQPKGVMLIPIRLETDTHPLTGSD